MTVLEYLAQGLPFLSFKTGEIVFHVNKEFPEFVIDNWNEEEWIARINKLLNHSFDKENLKAYFDRHFGEDQYVAQCLKIYQSILSQN